MPFLGIIPNQETNLLSVNATDTNVLVRVEINEQSKEL